MDDVVLKSSHPIDICRFKSIDSKASAAISNAIFGFWARTLVSLTFRRQVHVAPSVRLHFVVYCLQMLFKMSHAIVYET